MLEIFKLDSHETEIDAKVLQSLLNEIVTPRLEQKGFNKKGNYSWCNNANQFRQSVSYMRLKGAAGTLAWGINIDFIPLIHANKLEYYKTEKKFLAHLWESTDEYRNSFNGGEVKKGIATHWGLKKAKTTIANLFDRYEEKILKWFEKANSIESLIDITEQQIAYKNFYNIHSPQPKYVLAFLLAKKNEIEKALQVFETIEMYQFNDNSELREKVKQNLLALTIQQNGI